jgi:PTH1 family peptidyl-tRNA hydrolase
MLDNFDINKIKVIVGLGNPGSKYYKNRHSIGFQIIDELANQFNANWRTKDETELAIVRLIPESAMDTILIKPQTYMNNSGRALLFCAQKGIKPEEVLVVHDELEKSFGTTAIRLGGSARGHNGLKSIIDVIGPNFWRLRFGIGRPAAKEEVSDYVLTNFAPEEETQICGLITKTISIILNNKQ